MSENDQLELLKEIIQILKIAEVETKIICWRNVEIHIDSRFIIPIKLQYRKKIILTDSIIAAAYYILWNVYFEAIILVREDKNDDSSWK